jgi:hypothetical protein
MTLISNSKANVNYMNSSLYNKDAVDAFWSSFEKVFTKMPKFRYKIKEIAGDFYYEEMSLEEAKSKILI